MNKYVFDRQENVISTLIAGGGLTGNPLVSVVMPVYNHPDYFRKSLLSVINQKCSFLYEIIIVDNCHPEFQKANQKIVEQLLCTNVSYYLNSENIGGVGSENRGILLAKGKYITFCHDDDLLYPDALQTLVNALKRIGDENCCIIGNITTIDEKDSIIDDKSAWDNILFKGKSIIKMNMYDFLEKNYTNGCGSLYNKERLIVMGGFRQEYIPCPDYALNVYYALENRCYWIRNKTVQYRVSQQGDSSTAYKYIVGTDRKIKDEILNSGLISRLFPRFIVSISMKVCYYNLYTQWSDEKPSTIEYIIYRIINRIWLSVLLFGKRMRAF